MRCNAAIVLLLLALCGCYVNTTHWGTPIPQEHLGGIVDGTTTRASIVQDFGPPSAFYRPDLIDAILGRSSSSEGIPGRVDDDIFTYQYVTAKARVLFFPILFLRFSSETISDTLVVFFDEHGVVKYHAFRHDESDPPKRD